MGAKNAPTASSLIVLSLIASVFCLYLGGWAAYRMCVLNARSVATSGAIERCWGGRGSGCTYAFDAEGQTWRGTTNACYRLGQPIGVRYAPGNPSLSDDPSAEMPLVSWAVALIGVLFLVNLPFVSREIDRAYPKDER